MSYQNYSCNNNQNYFVQDRSTSRVSQPPGGGSSFSIGGGNFSDATSASSKLVPGQRMDRQDPSPASEKHAYQNQYANQLQQQISQRNALQIGEGQTQTYGRHSRDPSPMQQQPQQPQIQQHDAHYDIPGLENHYQKSGQSYGYGSGQRDPSPMNDKQLYASQLKQQIEDKKSFQSVSPRMQNMRSGSGGSTGSGGGGGGTNHRGIADTSDAADEKYEKAMQLYRAGGVAGVSQPTSNHPVPSNAAKKEMGGRSGPSPPPHLQRRGQQEAAHKHAEPSRGRSDGVAMAGGRGKPSGQKGPSNGPKETQEPQKPSITVAMPPGGRSSLSLGWN